ncbi:lytic transglycosylase [Iodidimonas nitroreducens]|uniref:Lytic transglycosylase n=1 Tax=Iodidimonas nitroreducens TaxID=1236968 RepID=A0A5A7NA57_9PROT|nr:lytic transglycosylase domain-containing protein [Iodidimonas nitroreducens]GER05263.1 lytic transglycosylase [Iodidimonas nitroreducens]
MPVFLMIALLASIVFMSGLGGGTLRLVAPSYAKTSTPIPRLKPELPSDFLRSDEGKAYRTALDEAARGQLQAALQALPDRTSAVERDVIKWIAFTKGGSGHFEQLRAFHAQHPHWPLSATITRSIEAAITSETKDAAILQWFAKNPPQTGDGHLHYAQALMRDGQQDKAIDHLRAGWRSAGLSSPQERRIMDRYGDFLTTEDHMARVDYLLWQRARQQAMRMVQSLPKDYQALAKARNALMAFAHNVDRAVAAVPDDLQSNAGLVYDRAYWRRIKGKNDSAESLLLETAVNGRDILRPERWWRERHYQARKALREGRIDAAYRLAADHAMLDGLRPDEHEAEPEEINTDPASDLTTELPRNTRAQIAEAEWLAGWIALRFQSRPAQALAHFQAMLSVVNFPVSLARGAYWTARAAEDLNDPALARRWYEEAARYPTVFYGQLALDHLGGDMLMLDRQTKIIDEATRQAFEAQDLVKAARFLARMGEERSLAHFVRQLVENAPTPDQARMAASLAIDFDRPQIGVIAAKTSVRDGDLIIEHGYPLIDMTKGLGQSQSLILSIARQESQFDPKAVSHVGALGLMQLMPATANRLARQLQRPYSRERLLNDPAFNLELGHRYFNQLLRRYDGAPMLALAAYNAGSGPVDRWIKDYGDPRRITADPIDWIEMIPYGETRNYVQRVLEAAPIYSIRLGAFKDASLSQFIHKGRELDITSLLPTPKPEIESTPQAAPLGFGARQSPGGD